MRFAPLAHVLAPACIGAGHRSERHKRLCDPPPSPPLPANPPPRPVNVVLRLQGVHVHSSLFAPFVQRDSVERSSARMSTQPHVLVLGLGIVGSSIAATLAKKGFRVTAVEQYAPLHERGSSHGDTRIYRRVPYEGALYVDLAARSWEGWKAWGKLAGEDLLVACGGIDAGPAGSEIVTSARTLCAEYRQPCSSFTGQAFSQQYPVF